MIELLSQLLEDPKLLSVGGIWWRGWLLMTLFPEEEGNISDGIRNNVESRGKNQVGKAGGGSSRSQLTYTLRIPKPPT